MRAAADFSGQPYQVGQGKVIAARSKHTEAVPCCASVSAYASRFGLGFKLGERSTHHAHEPRPVESVELLLGIVQVENVDAVELQVCQAAFDLIGEKSRSKAMPAGHQIAARHCPAPEVLRLQIGVVLFARFRRSTFEGDVAALRADDKLLACRLSVDNGATHRLADRALGPLAPVIDGRVEEIQTSSYTGEQQLDVTLVFGIVAFTEICAHSDGRDGETGDVAIEVGRERLSKAVSEAVCGGWCCPTREQARGFTICRGPGFSLFRCGDLGDMLR